MSLNNFYSFFHFDRTKTSNETFLQLRHFKPTHKIKLYVLCVFAQFSFHHFASVVHIIFAFLFEQDNSIRVSNEVMNASCLEFDILAINGFMGSFHCVYIFDVLFGLWVNTKIWSNKCNIYSVFVSSFSLVALSLSLGFRNQQINIVHFHSFSVFLSFYYLIAPLGRNDQNRFRWHRIDTRVLHIRFFCVAKIGNR